MDFLLASTHKEVQEYLSGIDFLNSLGATLYDEHYENELVTEEQAVDYIVNTHRIFQVQSVVMKPIEEWTSCTTASWKYLLTMVDSYLDNGTYEYLIAGYYDENTMNKFAVNPEDDNFDLFEFIQTTPNRYEDEEPTECPSAEAGTLFRWVDNSIYNIRNCSYNVPGGCVCRVGYIINKKKFIFGICVRKIYEDNTTTIAGTDEDCKGGAGHH